MILCYEIIAFPIQNVNILCITYVYIFVTKTTAMRIQIIIYKNKKKTERSMHNNKIVLCQVSVVVERMLFPVEP